MADKSKTQDEDLAPDKAAREAVREADPADEALVFSAERLISEAVALTGYAPHEVAGALAGVSKKNLTVEETQAATKAWLGSPLEEA